MSPDENPINTQIHRTSDNMPEITPISVSVIVPVYNVIDYLEPCLNSLKNQTLQNIEIIVVDDGSTDGSGNICDKFAENDPRVRIIHKKNEGLSAARNDGLDIARGQYIMFVDGDDWVEPDFCSAPYTIATESDIELVIFCRIWHNEQNNSKENSSLNTEAQKPFPQEGITDKKEILTQDFGLIGVIVWNKLFHRRLFDSVRFPNGRLGEDNAITHLLIHSANNVYLLNKPLYHHRINRPGSIKAERSYKFRSDELALVVQRNRDLKQWGYISIAEEEKSALTYLMALGRKAEMSEYCDNLLRECKSFPGSSSSLKKDLILKIYKISPPLFDLISILSGKRIRNKNCCK